MLDYVYADILSWHWYIYTSQYLEDVVATWFLMHSPDLNFWHVKNLNI